MRHFDSCLSRLFRRFDRENPKRYLLRCRMAFAASLLLDPQLLVKEVAVLAGYEDQYHFSRRFKAAYGQSPESFRRLRRSFRFIHQVAASVHYPPGDTGSYWP